MPKYFVNKENIHQDIVQITGENFHHIKHVMRYNIDDKLLVSDGDNTDYYCQIAKVDTETIQATILETIVSDTEPKIDVTLFQPLIKGEKMELVIQKAVELGVSRIIPTYTKRCVVKLDKKVNSKIDRWNKIAEAAAKQSGRGKVPEVTLPMSFIEALDYAKNNININFIPYENETQSTFKIPTSKIPTSNSFGIFIGPEGGFEQNEIDLAMQHNVSVITLGKRILRSETASIVALTIIMHEMGEI
ncbi:MAG: hypothetical protein BEN19_04070 [Epulopiscium sp. Nuni2H_MBin003]|nr:MAG: hypothetical protein BEN19_04070 [Epulopiscium sp. Nuni2H_MBin003]